MVSPYWARYFLLRGQEKVPKETAARRLALNGIQRMPFRVPCASRAFGRSPNSQAGYTSSQLEQGGSLTPKSPAMLGGAYGIQVAGFGPVGAAEHRRKNRVKRAPCSSPKRAQRDRRVGRAPVFTRSAGNPTAYRRYAVGPTAWFAFLLGTFLWRSKEKYLARRGRNRNPENESCRAARTLRRPAHAKESTSPELGETTPPSIHNNLLQQPFSHSGQTTPF